MLDIIGLLAQELVQIDGPITRQKLVKRRNRLKAARKRDPLAAEESPPAAASASTGDKTAPAQAEPLNAVADAAIAVVLADLRNKGDISKLAKDYVIGGEPVALKVGNKMAFGSTLVVIFRLADVCSVAGKLSFWSKGRFDRIFLSKSAGGLDISNEIVIAVCANDVPDVVDQLMFKPADVDPVTFVLGLLNDLPGSRLHLFAEKETLGWSSVIGQNNWAVGVAMPSSKT